MQGINYYMDKEMLIKLHMKLQKDFNYLLKYLNDKHPKILEEYQKSTGSKLRIAFANGKNKED